VSEEQPNRRRFLLFSLLLLVFCFLLRVTYEITGTDEAAAAAAAADVATHARLSLLVGFYGLSRCSKQVVHERPRHQREDDRIGVPFELSTKVFVVVGIKKFAQTVRHEHNTKCSSERIKET
jgi:hypothetical protein